MIARHFLAPAFLFLCIMLGGASGAGFMPNLILQLIALIILVAAFMAKPHGIPASAKTLQWLTVALFATMILQLVPLPPSIWTSLPEREGIAEGFGLLGEPLPWLPLSMTPAATLAAALWLLPAAAVLFAMLRLGAFRPVLIASAIIAATLVAVLIGALQVSGAGNAFYFYAVTNRGLAVGPFANANHMATLLLVAIPFLFALAGRARRQKAGRVGSGLIVTCAAILLVIAVGLALNTSLAGIGLAIPVVASSSLLLIRRSRLPKWAMLPIGLVSIAAIALVFLLPIGNNLVGEAAQGSESRATSISATIAAAVDHLPVGSGYGSFAAVYRGYEDPQAITATWMNHAHSDLVEILLEGGIFGGLMVIAFITWWTARTIAIWRESGSDLFARGATISSAAIVLHSLVDYPLRTAAISVTLVACLALMTTARQASPSRRRSGHELRHHSA